MKFHKFELDAVIALNVGESCLAMGDFGRELTLLWAGKNNLKLNQIVFDCRGVCYKFVWNNSEFNRLKPLHEIDCPEVDFPSFIENNLITYQLFDNSSQKYVSLEDFTNLLKYVRQKGT